MSTAVEHLFNSVTETDGIMRHIGQCWILAVLFLIGQISPSPLVAQEPVDDPSKDTKGALRLEFMRKTVDDMKIASTNTSDTRELKMKAQPILRYNDPTRSIADSALWRIGTKGRPIAIVTTEVYGPATNNRFQINHEFLALERPRFRLTCGQFLWAPPTETTLKFMPLETDLRPADKPQLRLIQMKRLSEKFTLREFHQNNEIQLRTLPNPIDRYEPSDNPHSDGAIFAGVWGVNPEILLFIETDGQAWSYAFARMGAAKLWAILDDVEVWSVPNTSATGTNSYALYPSPTIVPIEPFSSVDADKKP